MGGETAAFAAAFVQIELDLETGKYRILDYLGVADCGTVIHPAGLSTQIKSGAIQGFGLAGLERIVYDPQNGLPASVGFLLTDSQLHSLFLDKHPIGSNQTFG